MYIPLILCFTRSLKRFVAQILYWDYTRISYMPQNLMVHVVLKEHFDSNGSGAVPLELYRGLGLLLGCRKGAGIEGSGVG